MKLLVFSACFLAAATLSQAQKKEPALDFICPENDINGIFMDEDYCDVYYECTNGDPVKVTCDDGLLFDFNRVRQGFKCDEPFNVDCGNRTLLQDPQPSEDGVCPRRNGRFEHPDPGQCDQYVICRDGIWTLRPCAPGLHYDPFVGQCTWPDQAKRSGCGKKKQKLPDGFECPDPDTSSLPSGSGPRNPNPTFPHNTSCTQFYVCVSGVEPRLNVCSSNLVYNIDTGTCDDVVNVPECAPAEEETAPAQKPKKQGNANRDIVRRRRR